MHFISLAFLISGKENYFIKYKRNKNKSIMSHVQRDK